MQESSRDQATFGELARGAEELLKGHWQNVCELSAFVRGRPACRVGKKSCLSHWRHQTRSAK